MYRTTYTNVKNSVIVAAMIAGDGTITRRVINVHGDEGYYFDPTKMYSINDGNLLPAFERDRGAMVNKSSYQCYSLKLAD